MGIEYRLMKENLFNKKTLSINVQHNKMLKKNYVCFDYTEDGLGI